MTLHVPDVPLCLDVSVWNHLLALKQCWATCCRGTRHVHFASCLILSHFWCTSKTSTFHFSSDASGLPVDCLTIWAVRLAAFLQTCPLVECWQLQCHVGLLKKKSNAILTVRSRVWAETFIEVRGLADVHYCWWQETSDSRYRLPTSNNVLPYRSNDLLSFCYGHIKSNHIFHHQHRHFLRRFNLC